MSHLICKSETIKRIRSLPQVLQDLIAEYNADHRGQMFAVHREIIQFLSHAPRMRNVFYELYSTVDRYCARKCDNCTNYIKEYNYVESVFMGHTYEYCSDRCCWESEYDMRKQFKRDMRRVVDA